MFLGDQGLAGGHSGFWGMGDHARPLAAFDWTTWIPMIFRQKGRMPAGARSDHLVSNYDVLPTLLEYLGLDSKRPTKPPLPGRSFAATLEGHDTDWDDTVFFEVENVRSIRTAEWKYIDRIHQKPNALYHLETDPGERMNLFGAPEHGSIQQQLKERLNAYFDRYAEPRWNLWKGGASKTDIITEKFFGIKNPYRPSRYEPQPGEGKPQ